MVLFTVSSSSSAATVTRTSSLFFVHDDYDPITTRTIGSHSTSQSSPSINILTQDFGSSTITNGRTKRSSSSSSSKQQLRIVHDITKITTVSGTRSSAVATGTKTKNVPRRRSTDSNKKLRRLGRRATTTTSAAKNVILGRTRTNTNPQKKKKEQEQPQDNQKLHYLKKDSRNIVQVHGIDVNSSSSSSSSSSSKTNQNIYNMDTTTTTIGGSSNIHHLRLSREQEYQMTHSIRSLRRAVRIRDALAQQKEERSATFHTQQQQQQQEPPMISAYSDSYDDDLEHDHVNDDDFPTERQWADACGLSVMDLRRVMAEGQEARTILVSANAGLVTSIAKRHYHALKRATEAGGGVGTILSLQDMVQGE
jgi:Sec-independent protein translocase protein TatA